MTDIKFNVVSHDGSLLMSAVCSGGTGSRSAATQTETMRTIERAADTPDAGRVEIVIDGKVHSVPITSLRAAWEPDWSTRPLDPLVPFAVRTYTGCDATTALYAPALGRGINVGQMWEAIAAAPNLPYPGGYRDLRPSPELFRRIKLAGFDHVRLPCCWTRQASGTAPYSIHNGQATRYKQDVDAALAAGLKVIINQHHSHLAGAWSGWTSEPGASLSADDILVRQRAIVVQVAQLFVGYPADKLFMEIENEPTVYSGATAANPGWTAARWESYWPSTIAAIRAVDPERIILLGGINYNATSALAGMGPITDRKTVLMAHPYEPHPTFTHQFSGTPLWTLTNRSLLQASIDLAYADSVSRSLPCIMTEYGANFFIPLKHRVMHARDGANMCAAKGFPYTYWNCAGGGMDAFAYTQGRFFPGMAEALTGVTPPTYHDPIGPSGSILDWKMTYWGLGTGSSANTTEAAVAVSGDTLTFNASGTHTAYYVASKVDIKPGMKIQFTLSGTGGGSTTKIMFQKLGPSIGNWEWTVQMIQPPGAGANSTPAWGDHGSGTFTYTVPDLYPTDPTHTEVDPWGFRFMFYNMVPGATRTVVAKIVP